MKSFFVAILSFLMLLCSVSSCKHVVAQPEGIAFDTLSIDTVCPLFKNYTKPACHVAVKLAYPDQNTPSELQTTFRNFVASLPADGGFDYEADDDFFSMTRNYIHNYILTYLRQGPTAIDSYGEDLEAASTWMNYEEIIDGQVTFNDKGVVCYQLRVSSYSGGAHGSDETSFGVFELKSRSRVELEDVFSSNNLPQVNELLRLTLAKNNGCETVEDLAQKGLFFSPSDIEISTNFAVSADGMTWQFAPYEIAPFSTGEVTVTLPWSELRDLMIPDSPLMSLAQ